MRLRSITVQNFRNIAFAELKFGGGRQFFTGENAQGKTNLLEAAGFISALRSFRTSDERTLIARGNSEAAIACVIEHEKFGETQVTIRLRAGGKEVRCDGERIRKLGDYLGRFPIVVFTSQDMLLVRGSPGERRRWLDLAFAGTDAGYLRALQDYHRALVSRNQLLKRGGAGAGFDAELSAFEQPLARAAAGLSARRAAGIEKLNAHAATAYARIAAEEGGGAKPDGSANLEDIAKPPAQSEASPCPQDSTRPQNLPGSQDTPGPQDTPSLQNSHGPQNSPGSQNLTGSQNSPGLQATPCHQATLTYAPSVAALANAGEDAWAAHFAAMRQRDIIMRATLSGPHRDDCDLDIGGRSARAFASEGQQRSLALSLRLAEAAYLRGQTGVQPVLLADDVLGELDPQRRRRFWAGLNDDAAPAHQILATGTTPPDTGLGAWQLFEVRGGGFAEIKKDWLTLRAAQDT
ncbi:MAG: DNA replication and repair protein RecF [Opitutaceae bacterium]|jgi:DNA replication and repair protein RecF|nr:DNA replication and repair protein RecF [Opitutaceae bacterium]